jgi:hypothetical protein
LRLRLALAVCAAIPFAGGASAAELPSRSAGSKAPEAKPRQCFINGEPGFETPGGGCVRVSGYISSQVSGGALKH